MLAAAGSRLAALFSAAGPCVAHLGTDGAWEREIESGCEAGYVRVGRFANQGCRPACGGACGVIRCRARLYTRWLAQPSLHGLFKGEVLVFLLFKGKLMKHANHRTRLGAVQHPGASGG